MMFYSGKNGGRIPGIEGMQLFETLEVTIGPSKVPRRWPMGG